MSKNKQPNMQRRQPHTFRQFVEAIIETQHLQIASLAWQGYQEEGRGFVLVTVEGDEIGAGYHGEKGALWRETELKSQLPMLAEFMEDYDPKTEIVVLANNEKSEEGELFIFGSLPLPPPLAHEKLLAE